jgi:pilus assembly protein Flp/PilA
MKTRIVKFYTDAKLAMDDRGASAVEYGLLVAGIAAVIVAAVFLLGGNVNDALREVNSSID